jgi:hypothetical protein
MRALIPRYATIGVLVNRRQAPRVTDRVRLAIWTSATWSTAGVVLERKGGEGCFKHSVVVVGLSCDSPGLNASRKLRLEQALGRCWFVMPLLLRGRVSGRGRFA